MMKFSKRDSKKMIKEMARLHGLSVSEVREQIQGKIIDAMNSDDPEQQAQFKRLFGNSTPTPEEFICIASRQLNFNDLGVAIMGQAEKQKEVFLSVCGQHDYNLLTGKEAMTQTDFERITYITMALGYTSYTQELIGEHLDLACNEAERADREFDILQDYPAYYDDENVYEQRDKWLADFISQVPPAKQDDIRQLIKENTEII